MSVEINGKASNRAAAASKQVRIGKGGSEVEKSLKRPILRLDYPVSANRYWRTCRGRTYRSSEAEQYKASVNAIATAAGLIAIEGPAAVSITMHPKLTKKGVASLARMDLDNCIKVTLDALNGVAYLDDSQVVKLVAEVGEAKPCGGLSVVVEAVHGIEAQEVR